MITIHTKLDTKLYANGLGVLWPTECTVTEEANGLYELDMVHPMDDELRYTLIEPECILKVPVPVRATPFTTIHEVENVVTYTVDAAAPLLARAEEGAEELAMLATGETVVLMDAGETYDLVTNATGESGYVLATNLTYDNTVAGAPDESNQSGMIRNQYFRIYKVEKNTGALTVHVWARHIFYDLLWKSIRVMNVDTLTTAQGVLDRLDAAIRPWHKFEFYTDSAWKVKKDFSRKNACEALLDPDDGLVNYRKPTLKMVRDNFNVFLLTAGGTSRNEPLLHGKNLIGVTSEVNYENMYNRITPICQNSKGGPYYYNSPTYIDSPILDTDNDVIRNKIIYYDDIKIGQEDDAGNIYTTTSARTEMATRVAAEWTSGVDKPEYNMKVEFVLLGDTVEYAAYRGLDRLYIHDTIQIIDSLHDISVSAAVTGYDYDVLAGRYTSLTLGTTKGNQSLRLISGYQIRPGAIPGVKIAPTGLDLSQISVGGEALTIGPRNYLTYSDFTRDALELGWSAENATVTHGDGVLTYEVPASDHGIWSAPFTPPALGQWTLTFYASGPVDMVLDNMQLYDIEDDTTYDLADYVGWVPPVLSATRTRYEITFTVTDAIADQAMILFGGTDQTAGTITIDRPMLAQGNVAYDWVPAPEDPAFVSDSTVATGVSLSDAGLYLSGPTVELETDQLKVVSPNAERVMLDLTEDGLFVDADVMSCQNISGNVLNTFADSSIEFEGTIQGTIDNLPKYLTQETTITVPSGIYNEDINIIGFIGQKLYIVLENGVVINGNILISGCSTVHLYSAARGDSKIFSNDGICLRIYYGNAHIQNIRFYGGASTTQGVVADFAKLLVVGCGFNNIPSYCVMWRLASNGWSYNNVGSSNGSYAIRAEQGSDVHVSGTLPDASSGQTSASFSQINTYGTVTSTTSASSVSSTDAVIYTSTAARRMAIRQIRYGSRYHKSTTIYWVAWSTDSYINWAATAPRQGILQYSIQHIGYSSYYYSYRQYQDVYKSVWIFDSFAVSGKTIQSAKITIIRAATIGSSGAVTLKLYRHAYTSAPTGSSFSLTDTGQTLSLLPGQKKTLVLNSTQISLLNAGTTKGFGLTDDGYLMSCSTIAKIEMTYA